MKTIFNYHTTILSDVQPFEKLLNFSSLNFSILLSRNYYYYISLSLKMIKGCRYRLLAEIHSMIIVYLYRPGCFLKVLRFLTIPNIRSLTSILYIKLVLSIFHRSVYIIFLIAGRSKSGNYT